ncbi:MAG TPA: hypothetical protein VNI61_08905 [Gemmatimonadales bacterium]|nr:hypothetical protein [Gemmatimonadales bacterium]
MSGPPPFPTAPPPRLLRVAPAETAGAIGGGLRNGALVAPAPSAVVELLGPGAVPCFQGLLTNDIEAPGDGAFVYGALLTPKGMIVAEGWAARNGPSVRFTVPVEGHEATLALLARSVPPRLARTVDRTRDLAVLRVVGPHAAGVVQRSGLPVPPAAGRIAVTDDEVEVARAPEGAPFAFQVTAAAAVVQEIGQRLERSGALVAGPAVLELSRIVAGWPRLAAEVDLKTIPQEVRFDEIGGVSYTKGCYTGQETVSRLHFRGHTNRELRGLEFAGEPPDRDPLSVVFEDREVGRVTSLAHLPDAGWIGLAVLRREVSPGAVVRVADAAARVVMLPFSLVRPRPA